MSKRLLPNHPLDIKVRKLEQFLFDNKLKIEFNNYYTHITDLETNTSAEYIDADSGRVETEIPSFCESKLIIQD